jgi:large subunit ribosomal protein L15
MNLDDVNRGINKYKKRKRVGRGPGSGHGKTCGRGHKGQGSRAGFSRKVTFQGGTMPMIRRIPKRGFNNKWALTVAIVNIEQLDAAFSDGDEITPAIAREKRLIGPNFDVFKVLGNGAITKKLNISAHRFSASAKEKIEKAGGSVTILPGKKPVPQNKQGSRTKK